MAGDDIGLQSSCFKRFKRFKYFISMTMLTTYLIYQIIFNIIQMEKVMEFKIGAYLFHAWIIVEYETHHGKSWKLA